MVSGFAIGAIGASVVWWLFDRARMARLLEATDQADTARAFAQMAEKRAQQAAADCHGSARDAEEAARQAREQAREVRLGAAMAPPPAPGDLLVDFNGRRFKVEDTPAEVEVGRVLGLDPSTFTLAGLPLSGDRVTFVVVLDPIRYNHKAEAVALAPSSSVRRRI